MINLNQTITASNIISTTQGMTEQQKANFVAAIGIGGNVYTDVGAISGSVSIPLTADGCFRAYTSGNITAITFTGLESGEIAYLDLTCQGHSIATTELRAETPSTLSNATSNHSLWRIRRTASGYRVQIDVLDIRDTFGLRGIVITNAIDAAMNGTYVPTMPGNYENWRSTNAWAFGTNTLTYNGTSKQWEIKKNGALYIDASAGTGVHPTEATWTEVTATAVAAGQEPIAANAICVDPVNGSDSNTGLGVWANAKKSLQTAIDVASASGGAITKVFAKTGTYQLGSVNEPLLTIILKSGISVYGGFCGVEYDETGRFYTWPTNATMEQYAPDMLAIYGVALSTQIGSKTWLYPSVIYGKNACCVSDAAITHSTTSIFNGFTVTNAKYLGSSMSFSSTNNTKITISHCIISDNTNLVAVSTAGIFNGTCTYCNIINNVGFGVGGSGTCSYCIINKNTAGGATNVSCSSCLVSENLSTGCSTCTCTNCVINNNTISGIGGGCVTCTCTYCVVVGNSANSGGGCATTSIMTSCLIIGNTALSESGGAKDSTLTSCIISNNSGFTVGGVSGSSCKQCIISNNLATRTSGTAAGGIQTLSSTQTPRQCAILNNKGNTGGIYFSGATTAVGVVANNIITGNVKLDGTALDVTVPPFTTGSVTLQNCYIGNQTEVSGKTGVTCTNTIYSGLVFTADTSFKGIVSSIAQYVELLQVLDNGGFKPTGASTTRNTGNNADIPSGITKDINGVLNRTLGGTVDIGPYEYQE